ncbi:MAG TPA: hypothetical protein VGM82_08110 [Gemmatimonadaceae bacterium]
MSLPGNNAASAESSPIAGSVLPIQRAEELLATLPGVLSARIVASANGSVDEIHILTTTEVTPKQTVRNVESALIAHLAMRVSHKKISVATTSDEAQRSSPPNAASAIAPSFVPPFAPKLEAVSSSPQTVPAHLSVEDTTPAIPVVMSKVRRRLYFEDIEVRRSRSKGVSCRVTLRKGEHTFVGQAEGVENERFRLDVAARATLDAIKQAEGDAWVIALEGCKLIDAFDRHFVFVGVLTRHGRDNFLVTGSAEVRESPETASALAVLDATNRWSSR